MHRIVLKSKNSCSHWTDSNLLLSAAEKTTKLKVFEPGEIIHFSKKGVFFGMNPTFGFCFLYFRDSSYLFGNLVLKLRSEYTSYRKICSSLPLPLDICRIFFCWPLGTDASEDGFFQADCWGLPSFGFCRMCDFVFNFILVSDYFLLIAVVNFKDFNSTTSLDLYFMV